MLEVTERPGPIGIKQALLITFTERLLSILAMFLVTMITARLLTPADFAVVAIGISINFVVQTVQDFGIGNYLVQKKDLTRDDLRAGFSIVAVTSVSLAVLLLVCAAPLQRFVGLPGLSSFVCILAATALTHPWLVPGVAMIRRDQRYDLLAAVSLGTSVTNAVALVSLVAAGFGFISFAYALLLAGVVGCTLVFLLRPVSYAYRLSLVGWRSAAGFGFWSALSDTMARTQDLVASLVLSRSMTPDMLGMFNRASYLATLPPKLLMAGSGPVAMAGYAAAARSGGDLKQLYLHSLSHLCCLIWPMCILLAVLADPVTRIMLGREWAGATEMVRILAIAHAFAPPTMLAFMILSAAGAVRQYALLGIAVVVAMAGSLIVAGQLGANSACMAIVIVTAANAAAAYGLTQRRLQFTHGDAMRALAPSVLTTVAATAVPAVMLIWWRGQMDFSIPTAAAVAALSAGCWLTSLYACGHPLWPELMSAWRAGASRLRQSR